MGYSYDVETGQLCCDICGKSGAIKRRCPVGWCPPLAACPECWAKPEIREKEKAAHVDCRKQSAEYQERAKEERRRIDAGEYLRCSAIALNGSTTKVTFRGKDGEKVFVMSRETYHAFPLLTLASPDDFRKHGEVIEITEDI